MTLRGIYEDGGIRLMAAPAILKNGVEVEITLKKVGKQEQSPAEGVLPWIPEPCIATKGFRFDREDIHAR